MRISFKLAALLFAFLLLLTIALLDSVPAPQLTDAIMSSIERRFIVYHRRAKTLPQSLDDLPTIEGKIDDVVDGWGREIEWWSNGSTITLRSLGADGQVGGVGDDADIMRKFQLPPTEDPPNGN